MKMNPLALAVVALTFAATAETTFGTYHPRMGRFMQRDPHGTMNAPAAPHVAMVGPAAAGRFVARDPMPTRPQPGLQYADGMNLYQYVGSNPVAFVDPSGLASLETCCAMDMKAVLSGKFEGGLTIDSYYPKLKGTNYVNSENPGQAGHFDNATRVGGQAQLVGKVWGNSHKCSLEQWLWVEFEKIGGRDSGRAGKNYDDIKKSGRNARRKPFRQTINTPIEGIPGAFSIISRVTMADPASYPRLKNTHGKRWFTTCIASGGYKAEECCEHRKCCVKWFMEIEIDAAGKVKPTKMVQEKSWCEKWK